MAPEPNTTTNTDDTGAPGQIVAPPQTEPPPSAQMATQLGLQQPPPVEGPNTARVRKQLEAALAQNSQVNQQIQQWMRPDAIQQLLPKPSASGILNDLLLNFTRGGAAAQLGWGPPEPIQMTRLKTALQLHQATLGNLHELDANNKYYLSTLAQQLNLAQQADRNQNTLQLGQERNEIARENSLLQAKYQMMLTGLRVGAYTNEFPTELRKVTGAQLVNEGTTELPMFDPTTKATTMVPVDPSAGQIYTHRANKLGTQDIWVPAYDDKLLPTTAIQVQPQVDPATGQTVQQVTQTTTTRKATPGAGGTGPTGSASPAKPATIQPPAPPPPAASGPGSLSMDRPAVRPFDPKNRIDARAAWVASDSKNLAALDGNHQRGRLSERQMVEDRMIDLGVDPNNIDGSVRERAKNANAVLAHIQEVRDLIDEADRKGVLGVVEKNWNRFLAQGNVALHAGPLGTWKFTPGVDPTSDQIFSKLSTNMEFLSSAVAMAHGGLRGGGSPQMVEHWESALQGSDKNTMLAKLGAAEKWMKAYAGMLPSVASIEQRLSGGGGAGGPGILSPALMQALQAEAARRAAAKKQ